MSIELQRMSDGAAGEIGVYDETDGQERKTLQYQKIHLLNGRDVDTFSKLLEQHNSPTVDWRRCMTYVVSRTVQALRNGAHVDNINAEPQNKAVEYAIYPFLPRNEPTTIYGPGGRLKSVLADLFAVMFQFGTTVPGLPYVSVPKAGNVLYLDWERDREVHRQRISAIKATARILSTTEIAYIRCNHSIADMFDYILKEIADLQIELVILDSEMAATAGMGNMKSDSEVTSTYHNYLRRFNCTTLSIDHTTKAAMADDLPGKVVTPINSVVKWNRVTSAYSIETLQETESDVVQLKIRHEKNNLGRKQADRGIEAEFENNDRQELVGLRFREFNLGDVEVFRRKLPQWQIIESILQQRAMECNAIVTVAKEQDPDTRLTAKSVYDVMNQKPKVFVSIPNTKLWALVSKQGRSML